MPLITIIFNNYDAINEAHENLYDDLPNLVRDSERCGIIYIFTANATNSVYTKISQNFKNAYAYKLKDASDYMSIFNSRSKLVPREIVGRGIFSDDGLHEFQTANIVENEETLNEYIMNFIRSQKQINPVSANPIPVLPDFIRLQHVEHEISDLNNVPVGISKKELEICKVNYLQNVGNIYVMDFDTQTL